MCLTFTVFNFVILSFYIWDETDYYSIVWWWYQDKQDGVYTTPHEKIKKTHTMVGKLQGQSSLP